MTGDPNDDYLVALSQATPEIDALFSSDPDLTTLVNPVPPVGPPPRRLVAASVMLSPTRLLPTPGRPSAGRR